MGMSEAAELALERLGREYLDAGFAATELALLGSVRTKAPCATSSWLMTCLSAAAGQCA